jgi:hypothetical protein
MQHYSQLTTHSRPRLCVGYRPQNKPCRRVLVKAAVTAPAEGQQTLQEAQVCAQPKGYKDALLMQCKECCPEA